MPNETVWEDRGNNMAHKNTLADLGSAADLRSLPVKSPLSRLIDPLGEALEKGILIFDSHLKIVKFNAAALIHSNVPSDFYKVGRSAKGILEYAIKRGDYGQNVDIDTEWNKIVEKCARRELSTEDIIRTCSDGRVIKAHRVFCQDGSAIVLSEDITKQTQQDQLMELAINGAGVGNWQFSLQTGEFTFSDLFLNHLSEAEVARIRADGFWPLIHKDDLSRVRKHWNSAFKSKTVMDFSYRLVLDKSGIIYMRNIGIPIFAGDGRVIGVNCLVLDHTNKRETIHALKRRTEDAERMFKLQNEYLANMSHEIRTPMNGVLGMTEALLHNPGAENFKDELITIRDSANMMLRLMDDTLDHAKITADKVKLMPELAVPRKILKTIKALWVEKAKANNTSLNMNITDNVPNTLIIDPLRYHQCLNNLLSNAIKFTAGGRVDIISTVVERGGKSVFVTAVRDTGIGMTPEQLDRVFTPYQQATDKTSANYGGTGLGMSIVKSLAELMGGHVTAKSAPGDGTTFALSVPLKRREGERRALPRPTTVRRESMNDAAPQPAQPALKAPTLSPFKAAPRANIFAEPKSSFDLSKLTVLVAEDNQINQLVVRSLLEPRIAEIIITDNGQQALEVLRTRQVDVVLMDIHMPVMDGIEATIAIRGSQMPWANTKIIALTADPEYQQIRICKNIGMNHALPKPLNFVDMISALETVFEDDLEPALDVA